MPIGSPPAGSTKKESQVLQSLRNFRWQESIPRVAADFLIVHASMIAAMAMSVIYQAGAGNAAAAHAIVAGFLEYYTVFFCLLSTIFPLVFLLNGFYTRSRAYTGRYKAWVVLRGVVVASMVFFTASFLLFGYEKVGRSAALPFVVLAACGTAGARILADYVQKRYLPKSNSIGSLARRGDWVLVLGGAGYIGSVLVERLLE